jgi:hypothetical protein
MECLANYIVDTPNLLDLISQCFNTSAQIKFVESAIDFLRTQQKHHKPDELFSKFYNFISSCLTSFGLKASTSYLSITVAFIQFRKIVMGNGHLRINS